jgi:hypothetical protein
MFGMEKEKTSKATGYQYQIEQDLQQPAKRKEVLNLVDNRLTQIKNQIREGSVDKQEFDKINIILQGYVALKRIISKVVKD